MFAIIETGGKQYKVEKGATLEVEKMNVEDGSTITLDKVVLISDNNDIKIGTPYVAGAAVTAKVLGLIKGEKIRVYKMKAKEHYQRTAGHRQKYTNLEITEIKSEGAVRVKAEAKKPAAVKKAAPKKTKSV
ncbi:MAG: 50S ribosomal protein L21 [Candidatus Peregrinibacteria bacterium]|nr:50S ribosomal protein L21 [Candidatus Peregrinibacteria bacterium]